MGEVDCIKTFMLLLIVPGNCLRTALYTVESFRRHADYRCPLMSLFKLEQTERNLLSIGIWI